MLKIFKFYLKGNEKSLKDFKQRHDWHGHPSPQFMYRILPPKDDGLGGRDFGR